MLFQVLVIAALLSGFVLLGLGVIGIRPNREIQWVPVDGRARTGFVTLGGLLLAVGCWWYLVPPNPDVGTTEALTAADAAFTSGNSELGPSAIPPTDQPDPIPVPAATPDAPAAQPVAETTPDAKPASAPAAPESAVAIAAEPVKIADAPAIETLSPSARALEQNARAPKKPTLSDDPVFHSTTTEEPIPVQPVAKVEKAVPAPNTEEVPLSSSIEPERKAGVAHTLPRARSVIIHVQDRLGANQAGEHLYLQIEGRRVADLSLDEGRPATAVAVHLPSAGRLRYRLTGYTDWKGTGRQPVDVQGCFLAKDGSRFEVQLLDPEGPPQNYAGR